MPVGYCARGKIPERIKNKQKTVMTINDLNYKEVIENNLTVIKFGAEWCGPCKMINPLFKEYETKELGVVIGVCDIEESPAITAEYGIRNIPTIIFLKDGTIVDKHVGVINAYQLDAKIEELKK